MEDTGRNLDDTFLQTSLKTQGILMPDFCDVKLTKARPAG
jgi:hypothetical protein